MIIHWKRDRMLAIGLVLFLVALVGGCGSMPPRTAASVVSGGASERVDSGGEQSEGDGRMGLTPIEDRTPISLEEIDKRLGRPTLLPSYSALGPVSSVSMLEVPAGLAVEVAYPNDVYLTICTDVKKLDYVTLAAGLNADGFEPFTDGRKVAYGSADIRGNSAITIESGTQYTSTHGEVDVPSRIVWNEGGMEYALMSPKQRTADLLDVARGMK